MFCRSSVNMPECFRYDVIHDLIRKVQLYAAVYNFRNGKQVLNQSRQPLCIVINVRKNLFPCLLIQHVIAVQQRIRVAGNGGQRGPEIMRNRTQKIGAKLFVLCKNGSFFLFSGISQVIQRQRALAEDGEQNAGCKCVRLRLLFHRNPDNTVNLLPGTDGKIQPFCFWKVLRRCSGALAVLPDPLNHVLFPVGIWDAVWTTSVSRINVPIQQSVALCRVNQNVSLHELLYLRRGHPIDLLRRFRFLELSVHIKKELRAISVPCG